MNDAELTEERMRRALGLGGSTTSRATEAQVGTAWSDTSHGTKPLVSGPGSSRLQRLASRSDSPSPLRQRLTELDRQLADERAGHEQSRGQLEQVQRSLAELQARAQRCALDHADELAAERQATIQAQRELDDLLFERERYAVSRTSPTTAQALVGDVETIAESNLSALRPELVASPAAVLEAASPDTSAEGPAPKPRGRPWLDTAPRPKPVRWWTAAYRAQAKDMG